MKSFTIIALSLFLLPLQSLLAQSELKIEIVNLKSNKGVVLVDLLDKNEESVEDRSCMITDNSCTLTFKDLPDESYAVRYFHDENGNDELDTNILGIPKEGFGFSNNAFGRFGPKDFEEWLFPVDGDTEISMTTRYL